MAPHSYSLLSRAHTHTLYCSHLLKWKSKWTRESEKKKRNISNVCIETKLIFVNLNEIPWAIHHNYYWHRKWKSLLKLFVAIWVWCCSPVTIHRLSALAHFSRLRLLAISVLHSSIRTVDAKCIESTFRYLSVSRKRKYFFSSFLRCYSNWAKFI